MEFAWNIGAVLGIIFLLILVPAIFAEGWKGFPLAAKTLILWLSLILGVGLVVVLAFVFLQNLLYVIAVVLGLGFVIFIVRSLRK